MGRTITPADLKIRYNRRGSDGHMFGGVSSKGEYLITGQATRVQTSENCDCDCRIVFVPNDGGPVVEIPVTGSHQWATQNIYWSMVNHNKALLGIGDAE